MNNHLFVFLASTNDAKIQATKEAFMSWFNTNTARGPPSVEVIGVPSIASGVHEQPLGMDETVSGAINRALNLQMSAAVTKQVKELVDAGEPVFLVGLESGIIEVQPSSRVTSGDDGSNKNKKILYDVCACAIRKVRCETTMGGSGADGDDEKCGAFEPIVTMSTGLSSGFSLPPLVAKHFQCEEPESPTRREYNASFKAAGFVPDPAGPGILSQLSAGRQTRASQMKESVSMALMHL